MHPERNAPTAAQIPQASSFSRPRLCSHTHARAAAMPKKVTQMPMCSYGAACTRKDCIYRHPPKAPKEQIVKSDEICKPYLAGLCAFGSRCHNRHPPREEAEQLRRRYASTACQWGENCRSEGCLFRHPWDDEGWQEPAGHGAAYGDNGAWQQQDESGGSYGNDNWHGNGNWAGEGGYGGYGGDGGYNGAEGPYGTDGGDGGYGGYGGDGGLEGAPADAHGGYGSLPPSGLDNLPQFPHGLQQWDGNSDAYWASEQWDPQQPPWQPDAGAADWAPQARPEKPKGRSVLDLPDPDEDPEVAAWEPDTGAEDWRPDAAADEWQPDSSPPNGISPEIWGSHGSDHGLAGFGGVGSGVGSQPVRANGSQSQSPLGFTTPGDNDLASLLSGLTTGAAAPGAFGSSSGAQIATSLGLGGSPPASSLGLGGLPTTNPICGFSNGLVDGFGELGGNGLGSNGLGSQLLGSNGPPLSGLFPPAPPLLSGGADLRGGGADSLSGSLPAFLAGDYTPQPGTWAAIANTQPAMGPGMVAGGGGAAAAVAKPALQAKVVTMPAELWLNAASRIDSSTAFGISDHMERYRAVNAPHARRADERPLPRTLSPQETRRTSSWSGGRGGNGVVGVLDLHYQSVKTAGYVLDSLLPAALETCAEVWVVTGTGHHTDRSSHQKSSPGGVLHAAVGEYLNSYQYTHYLGRDQGGHSGAFLVVASWELGMHG